MPGMRASLQGDSPFPDGDRVEALTHSVDRYRGARRQIRASHVYALSGSGVRFGLPGRRAEEDGARPGDIRRLQVHRLPLLPGGLPVQCATLRVVEAGSLREEVRHVLRAPDSGFTACLRRSL